MRDFKFRKKFTEQLSDLLEGDINLLEALNILKRSFKTKQKDKISKTIYALQKGKNFENAFENISKDKEFLIFIKTAESTGNLKRSLWLLKQKYNFISEIKAQVYMILMYPVIVIVIAIVILNILLLMVVPKFIDIYNDIGQELPTITKVVVNVSNVLINKKIYIIIGLILFISLIYFVIKRLRNILDKIFMKISIFKDYTILSFTQTMYASFASKVDFVDAMKLCTDTKNSAFKGELMRILKKIQKGDSIYMAFKNSKYFDDEYKSYVGISDVTGQLENTFNTLSYILSNRLKYKMKLYLKFLEPISILIIAIFVGLIVTAIMLPLFSIGERI